MKKLITTLALCLLFNQSVYCDSELQAKSASYEASVQYINKNFEVAAFLYKESLKIIKNSKIFKEA